MAVTMPDTMGYGLGYSGFGDYSMGGLGFDYMNDYSFAGGPLLGYGDEFYGGSMYRMYDSMRRETESIDNQRIGRDETVINLIDQLYSQLKNGSGEKVLKTHDELLKQLQKQKKFSNAQKGSPEYRQLCDFALELINQRLKETHPNQKEINIEDEIKKYGRGIFMSRAGWTADRWFDETGANEMLQTICHNTEMETKTAALARTAGNLAGYGLKGGTFAAAGTGALGLAGIGIKGIIKEGTAALAKSASLGVTEGVTGAVKSSLWGKCTAFLRGIPALFKSEALKAGIAKIGSGLSTIYTKLFSGGIITGLKTLCLAHPVISGTIAIGALMWMLA